MRMANLQAVLRSILMEANAKEIKTNLISQTKSNLKLNEDRHKEGFESYPSGTHDMSKDFVGDPTLCSRPT